MRESIYHYIITSLYQYIIATCVTKLKSQRKGSYAVSSVLASNDWYKIAIDKTGIHKLTYEKLKELGIENPALVKIFGAGAISLPEDF